MSNSSDTSQLDDRGKDPPLGWVWAYMARTNPQILAISAAATLAATTLWAVLAWRTPTSTFHFAPIVALAVGPWVARARLGRHSFRPAVITVAISTLIVLGAVALLASQQRMLGPTFWSEDGALGEAILFAAGAAVAALAWLIAPPLQSPAPAE